MHDIKVTEHAELISSKRRSGMSTFTVVLSIVNLCAGSGVGFALPLSATLTGPAYGVLCNLIGAFLAWYALDLLTKHLKGHDKVLNDELITTKYPKTKYIVLTISRGGSLILHAAYIIGNFMFMDTSMETLFWSHTSLSRRSQIIICYFIMLLLSLVFNEKFAARISAIGFIVPLTNLIAVLYYGFKHATPENYYCMRDSFAHPHSYGNFSISKAAGGVAVFQLLAQYYTTYYIHNSFPSLVYQMRTRTHARVAAFLSIFVLMIFYILTALIGQLPYACYGKTSQSVPPSEYIGLFTGDSFGKFVSVMFLIGLWANCPYCWVVLRMSIFQLFDWTGKRKAKYAGYIGFNIVIITVAALIDGFNVSIQELFQVSGIFCITVWMTIIPVFWECHCNGFRGKASWRTYTAIVIGIVILVTEFLQFGV